MNRIGFNPTEPIAINYQQGTKCPFIESLFLNVFFHFSEKGIENESLVYIKTTLEQINDSNELHFDYPYTVHELYLHIWQVTQIAKEDELGADLWNDFLKLFQDRVSLILPNRSTIKLNFSRELNLLENGETSCQISLSVLDSYDEQDLQQILLIDSLSFSIPVEMYQIIPYLQQEEGRFTLVARDNEAIIGTLFYQPGRIANIARLPEVIDGIGLKLLKFLRSTLSAKNSPPETLTLKVRESHQRALHLYQKVRFHEIGRERDCYQIPIEDAIIMACEFNQFCMEIGNNYQKTVDCQSQV